MLIRYMGMRLRAGFGEPARRCLWYATRVQRVFLIDTDTASDDAVALIMALRASEVRVAAITTVAGNVPVQQSTCNALYLVELCGADVPVYMGADKPLLRPYQNATWFHGCDGLGEHNYPAPRRSPGDLHAVDAIIQTVESNPDIVIVTLAPLTNLALALAKRPDLANRVSRCVVMGGAPCGEGNVTPAAEYNIWVDPEAARIVFLSGLPVEMIGWHLSRAEAVVNDTDIAHIQRFKTKLGDFAIECNSHARNAYKIQTGEDGISLPDPVAMSIALDPTIGTQWSSHFVDIETSSDLTRGMTVVDRLNVAKDERNQTVWSAALANNRQSKICWTMDTKRWKAALFRALK
ncbi:MAG TPA: nucleoside hydrolase [Terriglobales bacterium]|nr:nucleoside hydrolase [Terriglobales bacterium]